MNTEEFQNLVLEKFSSMEKYFDKFQNPLDNLESRFDILQSQTKENTDCLKALIYSTEFIKAEYDKIIIDTAKIQGDISCIQENMSYLTKDLSTMEVVTANNYSDFSRLKSFRHIGT
jgi:hypothetical protein